MGGAKFNTHSALTGGLGGSNGILKRPTLSNIIMGGMGKPPAKDSSNTQNPGGGTLVSGVDPAKNNDDSSL